MQFTQTNDLTPVSRCHDCGHPKKRATTKHVEHHNVLGYDATYYLCKRHAEKVRTRIRLRKYAVGAGVIALLSPSLAVVVDHVLS